MTRRRKATRESGRARAARLLRDTLCECREPAIVSYPKGSMGRYEHFCLNCSGLAR